MILFNRNDFPVRYFPTTAIIPIFEVIDFKSAIPYSVILNPELSNLTLD